VDGWYTIIALLKCSEAYSILGRFNADSGANYTDRGLYATNTTLGNWGNYDTSGMRMAYLGANTEYAFSVARFYAKSGMVRMVNNMHASSVAGATINYLMIPGSVWKNTADNITSFSLTPEAAADISIGSRMIVMKSNNFTGGTPTGKISSPYAQGSWVRINSQVLSSASATITFSSLDGDRDVVYYLSVACKDAATNENNYLGIRFNGDTGGNYGRQHYRATSTTLAGGRSAADAALYPIDNVATVANGYHSGGLFLWAASGQPRIGMSEFLCHGSGTTINNMDWMGHSWNNTADNITSMVLLCQAAGFAPGSQFDLYALRPNG
jgi:hypothetical protein